MARREPFSYDSMIVMVTLLLDDHYVVAVTTVSPAISAVAVPITVDLRPCAVALLMAPITLLTMAAALYHD